MNIIQRVAPYALSTRQTLEATMALAEEVIFRDIPGDLVECGVYQGANAAVMARIAHDRKLHLFDSFKGIPEAGPEDVEFLEAGHKAGLSACTLPEVQRNMREWDIPANRLVFHPGAFEETVPAFALAKPQIAMLRLDGDLYRSTKVCIEHLYPLVSPGGWVIVDDFALSGCRKAVDDYMRALPNSYPPIYFRKT